MGGGEGEWGMEEGYLEPKYYFLGGGGLTWFLGEWKGGLVVDYRVDKQNNKKLTVNGWGSLEYYTPSPPLSPPLPLPSFFPRR